MQDTLVLSASNLKHDVNSLAGQLTGRLLAFAPHFSNIARLLRQAERWCHAQTNPVFICRSPCLISAGGPLRTNLRGHTQRINNVVITKDDKIIATAGKILLGLQTKTPSWSDITTNKRHLSKETKANKILSRLKSPWMAKLQYRKVQQEVL